MNRVGKNEWHRHRSRWKRWIWWGKMKDGYDFIQILLVLDFRNLKQMIPQKEKMAMPTFSLSMQWNPIVPNMAEVLNKAKYVSLLSEHWCGIMPIGGGLRFQTNWHRWLDWRYWTWMKVSYRERHESHSQLFGGILYPKEKTCLALQVKNRLTG